MATITINIPVDKETWVMDGFATRFGYKETSQNMEFNGELPENPETNPRMIINPESLPAFVKRMIIHMIKSEANTGHNTVSLAANAVVANDIELT